MKFLITLFFVIVTLPVMIPLVLNALIAIWPFLLLLFVFRKAVAFVLKAVCFVCGLMSWTPPYTFVRVLR